MITTTHLEPSTQHRRYDIDWIRVIAIGLLIIYHTAVAVQPWGIMIGFIADKNSWPGLWAPMQILNVWRIPLLFFVSGMGVYFAMRSRTWKELMSERSRRIFLPYVFGMFAIVPIQVLLWRYNYNMQLFYQYSPAHLWFLGNIFAYVVIFTPLFYAIRNTTFLQKLFTNPLSILLPIAFLIAEALIIKPVPYEMYAMTWHGFFLGLIAFFFGYCFAFTGKPFWEMLLKWWWALLIIAVVLATLRLRSPMTTPVYLIPPESVCWILLVFTLGYKFLNRDSKALRYLSEAAYPVYIIHLVFQFLASMLIFPLAIPVPLQFVLVVVLTLSGCLLVYEYIIKRTKVTRILFGLKPVQP